MTNLYQTLVRLAATLVLVLCMHAVQAQSDYKVTYAPDGTAVLSAADAPAKPVRNGQAVVSEDGSVTTTETDATGNSRVVTYPNPAVTNLNGFSGEAPAEWIAAYKAWKEANPDYASFLSPREREYDAIHDYHGVYKVRFIDAQNTKRTNR